MTTWTELTANSGGPLRFEVQNLLLFHKMKEFLDWLREHQLSWNTMLFGVYLFTFFCKVCMVRPVSYWLWTGRPEFCSQLRQAFFSSPSPDQPLGLTLHYIMDNGGSAPEAKAPVCEAQRSLLSTGEAWIMYSVHLCVQYSFIVMTWGLYLYVLHRFIYFFIGVVTYRNMKLAKNVDTSINRQLQTK